MSKNINVNYTNLHPVELNAGKTVNQAKGTQMKVSGLDKKNSSDITADLSYEGKLRAENTGYIKHAREISVRESSENKQNIKTIMRTDAVGNYDFMESLRLDEPETYEKCHKAIVESLILYERLQNGEDVYDEYIKAKREGLFLAEDWRERNMTTGRFVNPANSKFASIIALEGSLSNGEDDISINAYGGKEIDARESMWRYGAKYNVLLSQQMLNIVDGLATFSDKDDDEKKQIILLVDKIDKSVDELRNIEEKYDGNLKSLQFGVTFDEMGNVTYHADYRDCENEDGIKANSVDELLQLLTQKK